MADKYYYLYILECVNGAYYTGITTEPHRRWRQHVEAKGAKYTKSFPPKRLLGLWVLAADRSMAQHCEYQVKRLTRQQKQFIVDAPQQLANLLSLNPEVIFPADWPKDVYITPTL